MRVAELQSLQLPNRVGMQETMHRQVWNRPWLILVNSDGGKRTTSSLPFLALLTREKLLHVIAFTHIAMIKFVHLATKRFG